MWLPGGRAEYRDFIDETVQELLEIAREAGLSAIEARKTIQWAATATAVALPPGMA